MTRRVGAGVGNTHVLFTVRVVGTDGSDGTRIYFGVGRGL